MSAAEREPTRSSSSTTASPVELAGEQDRVLRGAGGAPATWRSPCAATALTLTGWSRACAPGAEVVDQLAGLVRAGHPIAPGHDRHRGRRRRGRRGGRRRCSTTSSGATASFVVTPRTAGQKRYVDAVRASTITFGIGPAGTGKTYLAVAIATAALDAARGGAHHPHPARRRGRRAPGLPARRPRGQGRPLPAPALRRPLRHARRRARRGAASSAGRSRWRRWRSCAAAPSTTASSSSTRPRTPRPSR